MAIDLDEMGRNELVSLHAEIEKTLRKLHKKERKEALAAAQKAAAGFGFSLEELTSKRGSGKSGPKSASVAPKYANPEDKSQTWTGKGRQPNWYKAAIAAGQTPPDLEI